MQVKKIFRFLSLFIPLTLTILGCSTYYSMNGILTNQFDKTLDIDHQVKILVPDELQIWECDNQKVGNAWSSNKESPFIVVLPPGDHLFKIKVVQPICTGSYSNVQCGTRTAEGIMVSFEYIAGHIYELTFDWTGSDILGRPTGVNINVTDRTDNPDDTWQTWLETVDTLSKHNPS